MLWKVKGMNANFLKIKKSEKEKRKKKKKKDSMSDNPSLPFYSYENCQGVVSIWYFTLIEWPNMVLLIPHMT